MWLGVRRTDPNWYMYMYMYMWMYMCASVVRGRVQYM